MSTVSTEGCLRLLGSVACPAFEGAYVNPQNLSNAFPWMQGVTTLAQFDAAVLGYFSNPNQFPRTKFDLQLGCSNATAAALRWQRTVLCSMWTNLARSRNCQALLDQTSLLNSPRMVCRETCEQYSRSEIALVNSTSYCPTNPNPAAREGNITRDYVECTNWTTLASADKSVCVDGLTNEGNCGYGSSIGQLCSFCNPSSGTPDSCCYSSRTNLGTCGYVLPALASVSSSSASFASVSSRSAALASVASASASLTANAFSTSNDGLSSGQIAGIVVGSVVGGLLLLAALLFCCLGARRRRKRERTAALASATNGSSPNGSTSAATTTAADRTSEPLVDGRRKSWFSNFAPAASAAGASPEMAEKGMGGAAGLAAGAGAVGLGVTGVATMADRNAGDRDGGVGDGLIRPGQVVTVLWAYQSSLPDELDLRPGQRLRIQQLFDDAWGRGEFIDGPQSGRQGAFPLVCVTVNGNPSSSNLATRTSTDSTPRVASLGPSVDGHGDDQSFGGRPDSPLDPYHHRA